MKITPVSVDGRTTLTRQNTSEKTHEAPTFQTVATQSADEITQSTLQTAQATLSSERGEDVDSEKVARMQAILASGNLQVDNDALAASMLDYFNH